jgi:hypothetical protein
MLSPPYNSHSAGSRIAAMSDGQGRPLDAPQSTDAVVPAENEKLRPRGRSAGAIRSARHRQLRRLRLKVFRIALREFDVIEALIDRGVLTEEQSRRADLVEEALSKILMKAISRGAF